MAQVIFKFDKEKDIWNIWQTCNFKSSWSDVKKSIHPKVLTIAENKSFEECGGELEAHFKPIYNSGFIDTFVGALNSAWDSINNEFFQRLEKLTKKQACSENFIAYLTVMSRCPYNIEEKWFMVSFFDSLPKALVTAAHEIMHLQFHHYFGKDIELKIGEKKTSDLKEALTALLNEEFNDIFFVKDKGYKPHKELRMFISEEWKKDKDFDKLIEKCILFLSD